MPPRHRERLTTRILHPRDPDPSTEDIFSSALDTLFTDDTQQSHGVTGQSIIYRSPRFGDVYLQIPSHPDEEGGRLLFAHYLWNAGVIAAEAIERASCDDDVENGSSGESGATDVDEVGQSQEDGSIGELVRWDKRFWDMQGKNVLELGAATALPSLISTLSNARTVIATDHPSSPAITTNAIESNFKINVTNRSTSLVSDSNNTTRDDKENIYIDGTVPKLNHPEVDTNTQVSVCGYTWGTETFYQTQAYGKPATTQPELRSFDRIIIADCLWMPAQHVNLVKTVLSYLKQDGGEKDKNDASVPCALVVAGFHTGRGVVRSFVEVATGNSTGGGEIMSKPEELDAEEATNGRLRAIEIFEVDVEGSYRSWQPVRAEETKEQSKRWCMCAVLVRRSPKKPTRMKA